MLQSLEELIREDAELIEAANASQEPGARRAVHRARVLRHVLIRFIALEVRSQRRNRSNQQS